MSTERIIGIDFGTSTTVVRVKTYINGEPEGSPVFVESIKFDGMDTLPSLVLWDDGYNLSDAKRATSPEMVQESFSGTSSSTCSVRTDGKKPRSL